MALLTKEDIQKISLYIPFRICFAPKDRYSIISRYYPCGILGSVLIRSWDEDDREIYNTDDIGHLENDDIPVLRELTDMTDDEYYFFSSQIGAYNLSKADLAEKIVHTQNAETFFFCLSKHFDLFRLIDQGKAHLTTR